MNGYEAVFNCHKNNALDKAVAKYKEIYGENRFNKLIKKYLDNGIMSIFDDEPTKDTMFFVFYIQRVVNEKI